MGATAKKKSRLAAQIEEKTVLHRYRKKGEKNIIKLGRGGQGRLKGGPSNPQEKIPPFISKRGNRALLPHHNQKKRGEKKMPTGESEKRA